LLVIHAGGPILAKDTAKNVEVFVDLDGDGFDDNESDVNKDGVPDLVCPVDALQTSTSASDIFGGSSSTPTKATKKTNSQHFGLRSFSTRAQCVNRSGLKNGFPDEIGTGTTAGSAACPGGVCGI
jgi:hypothetical protein